MPSSGRRARRPRARDRSALAREACRGCGRGAAEPAGAAAVDGRLADAAATDPDPSGAAGAPAADLDVDAGADGAETGGVGADGTPAFGAGAGGSAGTGTGTLGVGFGVDGIETGGTGTGVGTVTGGMSTCGTARTGCETGAAGPAASTAPQRPAVAAATVTRTSATPLRPRAVLVSGAIVLRRCLPSTLVPIPSDPAHHPRRCRAPCSPPRAIGTKLVRHGRSTGRRSDFAQSHRRSRHRTATFTDSFVLATDTPSPQQAAGRPPSAIRLGKVVEMQTTPTTDLPSGDRSPPPTGPSSPAPTPSLLAAVRRALRREPPIVRSPAR
jgi:hypothetical protein